MKPSKGLFPIWTVPAAAAFLFLLHIGGIVDFHESDATDLRFRLRGHQKAHPSVVVVGIDDPSLKALGQWPWPRGIHASFLEILARFKPSAVFMDILFTETSPDPTQDEKLAESLSRHRNVILPFFYLSEKPFKAEFPIDPFRRSVTGMAYVNFPTQNSGKVHTFQAVLKTADGNFYPPAVMMRAVAEKKTATAKDLPLDGRFLWINFPGGAESFRSISFGEVIARAGREDNDFLDNLFNGSVVFIGHTATGTTDLRNTPFSSITPGVFVHAAMMHTLLTKKYLRPLPEAFHLLLLLLFSCSSALLFKKLRPIRGFFALFGILASYFLINFLLFVFAGWIIPLFVPMTVLTVSYILMIFVQYAEIHLQREISDNELGMAASIQNQFLPQSVPPANLFDVAFDTRFLKVVGGDLYDWTDLGNGRLAFCVGDVSGKGMPAALYMAKAMSDFRSIDKTSKNPGELLQEFNRILMINPTPGMFLTLFYGIADTKTKKLLYASAGHEPSLFFSHLQNKIQPIKEAQGMPLAMFETTYDTAELQFSQGDFLLCYSDGVKELRDEKGKELGLERLETLFFQSLTNAPTAAEVVQKVFEKMEKHQAGTQAHDDCTVFCLRF